MGSVRGEKGEKMARLIDADDLKAIRFHDLPYSQIVPTDCDTDDKVSAYKSGWNDAIDAIVESASTVDAVDVLRCKDCKFYATGWCRKWLEWSNDKNGFCSWSERRKRWQE